MIGIFPLHSLLLAGEGMVVATLLPLLAWLAASCFPKWAALRHLIWVAAYTGLLVLPPLALLLPAHFLIVRPVASAVALSDAVASTRTVVPVQAAGDGVVVPTRMVANAPVHVTAAVPAPQALTLSQVAGAVFALWLVGVAAILLHQIMALLGLCRLRRRSTAQEIPIPELRGPWQLRIATQPIAHGPLTWGIFRPVILLPLNAFGWPHERLVAALRHEIAHVRRHDTLTQMFAQLVCALYWPNPLVWLGAQRLQRDAEIAADDAVIAAGVKPSSYADALVALASEFRGYSSGLAMASPSALEVRVKSVLAPTQSHIGVTAMDVLKTFSLGTAGIALIALARPDLAVAQQMAPAAPVISTTVAASAPKTPATMVAQADPLAATAPVITPQAAPVRQKIMRARSDEDSGANKTPSSLPKPSTFVIRQIDITGLKHIAPSIALSYLKLPIGVAMDPTTFLAAQKAGINALEDTGLFTPFMGITFKNDGTYHLALTENPLINQVMYDNIVKIRTVGTLPLARVLLPTFDASPEQVENAKMTAMQFKQVFRYCDEMEKISNRLKGSIYTNLGDVVVSDLSPEIQKALAASKPGEALEPSVTKAGIEIIARCDGA